MSRIKHPRFFLADDATYRKTGKTRGLQGDVVNLSWPIAPLVLWAQMRRERGFAGSQPMRTAVHITWHGAQINFGELPPYLTYGEKCEPEERQGDQHPAESGKLWWRSAQPRSSPPTPQIIKTVISTLSSLQGCGSGSELDPDSIGSRRAKMTQRHRKKIKKFHVLKCWMFSFESWTFLL